jgi:SAM-dependent methyltransferase
MADETSKTRAVRGKSFEDRYLQGRVIDIGCGPDLIVPHAEPFDLEHGNAQEIGRLRPQGVYDAVYSSHCLEHMRDVPRALAQWWTLVRKGGYLVLVVPDEDLYEQGVWPSLFNTDHKATFRLGRHGSWSPVSYNIEDLVRSLEAADVISCELQDQGYDYSQRSGRIGPVGRILFKANQRRRGFLRRIGLSGSLIDAWMERLFRACGTPVDQTLGPALAQIQIVAHKRLDWKSAGSC